MVVGGDGPACTPATTSTATSTAWAIVACGRSPPANGGDFRERFRGDHGQFDRRHARFDDGRHERFLPAPPGQFRLLQQWLVVVRRAVVARVFLTRPITQRLRRRFYGGDEHAQWCADRLCALRRPRRQHLHDLWRRERRMVTPFSGRNCADPIRTGSVRQSSRALGFCGPPKPPGAVNPPSMATAWPVTKPPSRSPGRRQGRPSPAASPSAASDA